MAAHKYVFDTAGCQINPGNISGKSACKSCPQNDVAFCIQPREPCTDSQTRLFGLCQFGTSEDIKEGTLLPLHRMYREMIRLRLRDIVHVLRTIALLHRKKAYDNRQKDAYTPHPALLYPHDSLLSRACPCYVIIPSLLCQSSLLAKQVIQPPALVTQLTFLETADFRTAAFNNRRRFLFV